jgi:anti-sigma regulatory factor (Ser/Thr protein kinase)
VRHVAVRLEPDLHAPSAARRVLAAALPDLRPSARADALLVVSELVANAVQHGKGPVALHLFTNHDRLRIEVEDAKPTVGGRRDDSRGLDVVAGVARLWGVEARPNGKTVWAELLGAGGSR